MNYNILRDGQQYGPYTLGDLQRYVASGDILLTDMAVSEGMGEPVPVSRIVGTIAVPPPVAPPRVAPVSLYPDPPNLPWAVLLVIALFCGFFVFIWNIVLSVWLKKVSPTSKSLFYYLGSIGCLVLILVLAIVSDKVSHRASDILGDCAGALAIAAFILWIAARFVFRSEMQRHYNEAEGIPLSLSGVMTFFFGVFYFQYHVNQIVEQKRMAGIMPAF